MIVYIVVIIGVMYFVMIRPQKKKQKEEQKMRESIQVADEILTIGGIHGRVVSLKEILTMLIEQFKDITEIGINKEEREKNINDYFNIIKPHVLKYQKKMKDLANLYLVYGEKLKRLNSQDEERQEIEKAFFLAH
jgi:preprotein translocase YajC subunit